MNYVEELKDFGLHDAEARVYLFLLEEGRSTVLRVSHRTGIARTNCYHILERLKTRGLVREIKSGKKKTYVPNDPEALLREHLTKGEHLKRIVPNLRDIYTTQKHKPRIQFYDGWEQVKQIYVRVLGANEVYALGSVNKLIEIDDRFFKAYAKKLKARGVVFHDIVSKKTHDYVLEEFGGVLKGLHSTKTLPVAYEDIPTDILVWSDCVAINILDDPVFGTVITHPLLARTFRTILRVLEDEL